MEKKQIKIIGIDPGSRRIGVAVLYGSVLRYRQVKFFDDRISGSKQRRAITTISKIIKLYRISDIALKIPYNDRSKNVNKIVAEINEFATQKGIRLHRISNAELNIFFDSKNETELLEALANRIPRLQPVLDREKAIKPHHYHDKMLVAVAAAWRLYKKLDVRSNLFS